MSVRTHSAVATALTALLAVSFVLPALTSWVNGRVWVHPRHAMQTVSAVFSADLVSDAVSNLPRYGEIRRRALDLNDDARETHLRSIDRPRSTPLFTSSAPPDSSARPFTVSAHGLTFRFEQASMSVLEETRTGATPQALAVAGALWSLLFGLTLLARTNVRARVQGQAAAKANQDAAAATERERLAEIARQKAEKARQEAVAEMERLQADRDARALSDYQAGVRSVADRTEDREREILTLRARAASASTPAQVRSLLEALAGPRPDLSEEKLAGALMSEIDQRTLDPKVTAQFFFQMRDESRIGGLTHDASGRYTSDGRVIPVGEMVRNCRTLLHAGRPDGPNPVPTSALACVERLLSCVDDWMELYGVDPDDPAPHPFDDLREDARWGNGLTTFRNGVILPFKKQIRFGGVGNPSESTTLVGTIRDAVDRHVARKELTPHQIDWGNLDRAVVDFYSHTDTVGRAIAQIIGSLAKHSGGAPIQLRLSEDDRDEHGKTLWTYTLRIEQPGAGVVPKTPRQILRTGSKIDRASGFLAGYADYHLVGDFASEGPLRYDAMAENAAPLERDDDPTAFAHVLTFWGLDQ